LYDRSLMASPAQHPAALCDDDRPFSCKANN
jgi:hypothetical protein